MSLFYLIFIFVFLTLNIKDSAEIQNAKLILPIIVKAGSSATLLCLYDLEGASLYSVKWYRGQYEFFRFVPNENPPAKVFQIPGFHVDAFASNEHQVTLRNIPIQISGELSCEITTDAPRFSTSCVSENLTVIDFNLSLNIPKKQYHFKESIHANCTLTPKLPSTKLIFHWNSKKVSNEYIQNRSSEIATLRLNASYIDNYQKFPVFAKLRCSAILNEMYYIESKSVSLEIVFSNPAVDSKAYDFIEFIKSIVRCGQFRILEANMTEVVNDIQVKDDPMESSIPVPWGMIAAKTWGDPCLPPVLMVHGLQDNAGTFDRLMPYLPSTFFYVCIDLPGHGKSTRFPKGIYMDFLLYISAIRRVVLHLQWTNFYYVGHSLGGQMGSYYAALYPDEVKKLVILDTLAQITVSEAGFLKFYQERFKQIFEVENKMLNKSPPNYTYEEALNRMINHRTSPITREAAEALLKRSLKKGKNECYYYSTDQRLKSGVRTPISNSQHLSIVSKIQCPVLLIITKTYLHWVENFRKNNFEILTLNLFKSKSNFQIVQVDGHHDVHNNEPYIVAPHINKFLVQQKSAL